MAEEEEVMVVVEEEEEERGKSNLRVVLPLREQFEEFFHLEAELCRDEATP